MMKRIYICLMALISIISCFILYGCDDTAGKGDIREAFLKAYLTSNYENRYTVWLDHTLATPTVQVSGDGAVYTPDEFENWVHDYYACIQPYVSEELYNRMVTTRALSKHDEAAFDKGAAIYPDGLAFTEYAKEDDKTTYTFKADMRIDIAGESSTGTISGQITVQKNGETSLISNISIFKYEI